jgi:sodium transport system permease protein
MVIVGGADSPGVVAALRTDKKFKVIEPDVDFKQMVSEKRIRLAVEIPGGFEAALKTGQPKTVTFYYFDKEMKSEMGVGEADRFFRNLRDRTVERRLLDRGLSAELIKPFEVRRQNVAPPEKVGGNVVGGLVPYIIIILCFTGAMYPAIDLTAGEKERGTMETLLCSPVHRVHIVVGKLLMVLTASISTIALSLVSTAISIAIGGTMLAGVVPRIAPAGILGVFAMIAPTALFFAAVLLTISLAAKSSKEAQSYVSPLLIVIIMPAVMGMLPGVELTAKTAFVPILNVCLACKEMLSGVWHWNFLALIFGSTGLYAAIGVALCVRMFNREDVMFRG